MSLRGAERLHSPEQNRQRRGERVAVVGGHWNRREIHTVHAGGEKAS